MRNGGFLAAATALLVSCSLPAEPVKACNDAVNVYFTRQVAQLNLDALENVLLAVSTLKACPAAKAKVTGHIDGAERRTPRLGEARAANVTSLLTKNGIERSRITVIDAGLAAPADTGSQPRNRFVSIEWR